MLNSLALLALQHALLHWELSSYSRITHLAGSCRSLPTMHWAKSSEITLPVSSPETWPLYECVSVYECEKEAGQACETLTPSSIMFHVLTHKEHHNTQTSNHCQDHSPLSFQQRDTLVKSGCDNRQIETVPSRGLVAVSVTGRESELQQRAQRALQQEQTRSRLYTRSWYSVWWSENTDGCRRSPQMLLHMHYRKQI